MTTAIGPLVCTTIDDDTQLLALADAICWDDSEAVAFVAASVIDRLKRFEQVDGNGTLHLRCSRPMYRFPVVGDETARSWYGTA